jgi:hypothetical protein
MRGGEKIYWRRAVRRVFCARIAGGRALVAAFSLWLKAAVTRAKLFRSAGRGHGSGAEAMSMGLLKGRVRRRRAVACRAREQESMMSI